jgi:hypothetical protein
MSTCATPESEVRQAIAGLLAREPGFGPDSLERLRLFGTAPPFDTRHKLTVAAASAIGAYALAVEKWWHECTGQHQVIGMDLMQAACALHPGHFQKQSGYAFPAMSLLTELKADFFRTADSRWFFPVGATPKLRDAVLDLLQCANNQEALGTSVAKWRAEDIEAEFAQRKIPGAYARSREEWLLHPQGELLSRTGVIETPHKRFG